MGLLKVGIKSLDDRGRAVYLGALGQTQGGDLNNAERADDPGLADLRMRVWRMLKPDGGVNQRVTWRTGLWILGGVATLAPIALARSFVPTLPPWVIVAVWFPMLLLLGVMVSNSDLVKDAPRIITAFLREGRCPSCGYIVAGTPADADACVVCPECAAAWSLSRIGPSAVPTPAVSQYQRRRLTTSGLERFLLPVRTVHAVIDARGRAVHVIDPFLRRLDPITLAKIGERRAANVRRRMRVINRGRAAASGFIAAMMLFVVVFNLVRFRTTTGPVVGIVVTVFSLLFLWHGVGLLLAAVRGENSLNSERAARTLLDHLICPGCCTPLDDVQPDAHFVCECPLCHAAWSVPRHPGA